MHRYFPARRTFEAWRGTRVIGTNTFSVHTILQYKHIPCTHTISNTNTFPVHTISNTNTFPVHTQSPIQAHSLYTHNLQYKNIPCTHTISNTSTFPVHTIHNTYSRGVRKCHVCGEHLTSIHKHSETAALDSVIHVHHTQHVPAIGCKGHVQGMGLWSFLATSKCLDDEFVSYEVGGVAVFWATGSEPVHYRLVVVTLAVVRFLQSQPQLYTELRGPLGYGWQRYSLQG